MNSIDNLREYVTKQAHINEVIKSCVIAYIDKIEREVADMVPLPVDADGVPIHVGDVLEWSDGETFRVEGIGGNTLFYIGNSNECEWTAAGDKRHHHAPTVEDVLSEFVAKLIERGELTNGGATTIAEYAAKLQLKEG